MSWRPNVSATPRWRRRPTKSSAKAVVRAAGPQKKWVYAADTTVDTSGVGNVRIYTPVLLASDYEDNQGQQRERVVLDSIAIRGLHRMTPVTGQASRVEVLTAVFTSDIETAADIASNNLDPWASPATFEEYDVQLLRTWGYVLSVGQLNTPFTQTFTEPSSRYVSKAFRLKLRLREPMGLYLVTFARGTGTGQTSSWTPSFRIKMRSW